MLIDPNSQLPVIPNTHILAEELGLIGTQFEDPITTNRIWTIERLFAPVPGRALGGIRVRVVDNKGIFSFINQRDLELLLELARPADWCHWLGAPYPYINDDLDGWIGLCCDSIDRLDELHEYECLLRQQYMTHYQLGCIPNGIERTRRMQTEPGKDVEELLLFLWDKDPEINYGPDGRYETIERRWRSVETRTIQWSRLPLL